MSNRARILRLVLPSSPELDAVCRHLRAAGLDVPDLEQPGLHVVDSPFDASDNIEVDAFEIFRLAPADVATYVEHGISQIGIIHTDLLREARAMVWHPFSFAYGDYPLVLGALRGHNFLRFPTRPVIRIATSLPEMTRTIFAARGLETEVVAVEDPLTACLLGLADGFIGRLSDADALVLQGFRVLEVVDQARLKLIANRGSGASQRRAIQRLIELLEAHQPPAPEPMTIPFDDDEL